MATKKKWIILINGYSGQKVCKIDPKMTVMVIVRWNVENLSEDNGLGDCRMVMPIDFSIVRVLTVIFMMLTVIVRVLMVMFRVVLMALMVDCQCFDGGVDGDVPGGVQVLMMIAFRYKFALRPEEKPGLEGFLTFLWNKETGEVSVS